MQHFFRLLSCYTFIKSWPLPSSLDSCIRSITSLLSLNHHFGTFFYVHGCFRLDCPPYHEQSEIPVSIHVVLSLTSNGRTITSPNKTVLWLESAVWRSVLYPHESSTRESYLNMFRGIPAISLSDWPFTYNPRFIEQYCNIDSFGPFYNLTMGRS